MSRFLILPPGQLEPETLLALLEEFASRDGTDYGEVERTLEQKVSSLRSQLEQQHLRLLFDTETESWDLLPADEADKLLGS